MKTLILSILLLFTTTLLSAQNTNAPIYDNQGFFINGSILGAAWTIDNLDVEAESGAGIGVKLGYNFNKTLGVYAALDAANIEPDDADSYVLGHFDLGTQLTFGPLDNRFRPFLKASLTGMSAQFDDGEINGAGLGLGGGALIFLTEKLAFDVNYTHGIINLSEIKIGSESTDIDEGATTGRLFIGLAYHF